MLAALVAALLVPVLAGCGDNTPPSLPVSASMRRVIGTNALRVTGEHAGIGSSAQQASMEAWAAGYGQYQPQAVVAYDPQGSGAGATAFLQGAVSWAGTDIPLTSAQRSRSTSVCGGRKAVDLPVFVSPIAFVFHIDGLRGAHISLSAALIAQIFSGRITWWDDARIVRANPALASKLPHLRITPVWRSDQSGTSQIVSSYLAAAAPGQWTTDTGKTWPYAVGQGAKGTAGVATTVSQAQGTIGYVEKAQTGSLGTVALLQGSTPVLPEQAGASAFVSKAVRGLGTGSASSADASAKVTDLTLSPDYADTSADVYPLTQVSYLVTCPAGASSVSASARGFIGSWLYYIASRQAQDLSAQVAGSVPLPRTLGSRIQQMGRTMLKEVE